MINMADPGIDNLICIPEIEVYTVGDSNPDLGTGRIGWPVKGRKGVDNLRVVSSPSGAITTSPASPFPMQFNPNAPWRPMNP